MEVDWSHSHLRMALPGKPLNGIQLGKEEGEGQYKLGNEA
jgi:hypothetical protein